MGLYEKIINIYSAVSINIAQNNNAVKGGYAPISYIPVEDAQRLQAYTVYAAYYYGAFGDPRRIHDDTVPMLRDDGTAALIVDTFAGAVLGEGATIDFSSEIKNTLQNNTQAQARVDAQLAMLRNWWSKSLMDMVLLESFRSASLYGTGVIKLEWSPKRGSPIATTFDAGFFFPLEFDPLGGRDDIVRCALCWQEKHSRLGDVIYKEEYYIDENGLCRITAGYYKAPQGNKPTLKDLSIIEFAKNYDSKDIEDLPTGTDFIPLVWIPNNMMPNEFWGVSDLAPVIKLLDINNEMLSDIAYATHLLGVPVSVITGAEPRKDKDGNVIPTRIRSGALLHLPQGASFSMAVNPDLNEALIAARNSILSTMFATARMTEINSGRLRGGEIPSGVALEIMEHPFRRKVDEKRAIAADKVAKLLKFVARMFNTFGDSSQVVDNEDFDIEFGNILPTDRKAKVDEIVALRESGLLSLETALKQLRSLGVDIPDLAAEQKMLEDEKATSQNVF